jgi:hypothetical protein
MAPLCAEFGISRKTGYKIYERYKTCGITALTDRSRRPYRQADQLPLPVEASIVRLKREYPGWGAPKIREKLRQQPLGIHLRRSARCTPRCNISAKTMCSTAKSSACFEPCGTARRTTDRMRGLPTPKKPDSGCTRQWLPALPTQKGAVVERVRCGLRFSYGWRFVVQRAQRMRRIS